MIEIKEPYYNLKALREERGMDQQTFADSLGIKLSTYNQYETRTHRPKSNFWIAVAEKYQVSIDYLMGFCDDPHSTKYAVGFSTTQEEKSLIKAWRSADERAKEDVSHALRDFGFSYEKPKEKEA